MNVHRLFTWADQLLQLSPPGGAKAGSMLARLRASLDDLPACKELIKRFRADAKGLLECQRLLKTRGLRHETLSQCDPLIAAMPTAAIRQEFQTYLAYELQIASSLGLDHIGLPMSSDAIESLFGVAKRHGVGPIQDASRIALRLPALCGTLKRQEVDEVLSVSVARQQALTASFTSLTQQRREVLGHPGRLERLSQSPGLSHFALFPSPKNRSNNPKILNLSDCYDHLDGTPAEDSNPKLLIEKTTGSGMTEVSVAV